MNPKLPLNTPRMRREVFCPRCIEYSVSEEADPICIECKGRLIKTVKSALTGERIDRRTE